MLPKRPRGTVDAGKQSSYPLPAVTASLGVNSLQRRRFLLPGLMIISLALVGGSTAYRALLRVETESIELPGLRGGGGGGETIMAAVPSPMSQLSSTSLKDVVLASEAVTTSETIRTTPVAAALKIALVAAAAKTTEAVVAPPSPIPLLVIGIPTVKRTNDPDYVIRTLEYLSAQLSGVNGSATMGVTGDVGGPNPLAVRILILDNTRDGPNGHAAYAQARLRWCGPTTEECTERIVTASDAPHIVSTAVGSTIVFARNARPRLNDGNDEGNANVPGARVRAQARDVADVAELAAELWGASMSFYMFMEDDFRVCPQGLRALAYGLARAGAEHPSFNALRLSFGLNGGVLRGADTRILAAYLREHAARRPPDHLWVEWFAGERPQSAEHKRGRQHVAFRYNILEHFGRSSSLRPEAQGVYAYCYDELNAGVVFEVEAYKVQECGHDDIWPCWLMGDLRYKTAPDSGGIDFEALAKDKMTNSAQTWAR